MPDSSTILHKRNPNSGAVPTLASLSAGELAINTFDGKLFTRTTENAVVSFTNDYGVPFTLDPALSGAIPQFGNNTISQSFANVLGGYNNDVSGAASTTVNGEDNDIAGDLAFIGSGYKNKITVDGDYSAILAGSNNLISHSNSFAIGSNLSSHAANFTYVNNISASGILYGNGSGLTDVTSMIMTAQVKNADTVTLTRGTVVYTFGATGDTMSVKRASNVGDSTSARTLGLVNETIAPNEMGSVTVAGRMDGLSFPSPYVDGDILWLGNTPGTFTRIKPFAPEHEVYLGVIERANNGNGIAYIKVQNGQELDELHDVLITGVQAEDVLQRNSTNTLWINAPLSSSSWNSVYTNVKTNSASWGTGGTAQSLSFNEVTKDLSLSFGNTVSLSALGSATGDYLPLSGGTLTGTITGDLSATGSFYGDGSKLTGIVAGDTEATTLVRSNSGYWESAYSTVSSLSSNWQTTFTASSAYVSSNPTGITGASALTKLLQITQTGYNSITPASDTLYIIVG